MDQIKTKKLTVEQLDSEEEFILSAKPIRGVDGVNESDLATVRQLNAYEDSTTKTPIPTTGDFTIDWQTDLVPSTTKTYAQTYGNHLFDIVGVFDLGGGVMTPYRPNWSYTKTGANINIVTLTEVFTGELTII